jgi:hypothetical protein
MLRHFNIYANWHNHFSHTDEYFEYLLGNLGYMGKEIYHAMDWLLGMVFGYTLKHSEGI